ncbi:MAG: 2-oxo acid dehydrogenase subunit E2 [Acutalibacteraceae bacterium]|nr:2-oxo acid dehydrogenase subunit E2 [Clostridia bacterium]MEE1329805.1 2-oxo acid dehydrogenase subunit E2 [Acutalibacteraceae bacterium]
MRADGKRLRNTDPMYTVAAYVMNKRVDSMNMVTLNIPYDPIQEYLNEKRKQGIAISHLGVIIAAYLRTAAEFPLLNRFIMNCKPYARNEFAVAMVVLKSGEMDNGTMSKMYFNMSDTIFDVNDKINEYVSENRNVPEKNGTEKMIKILLGAPGVLRIGVGLFKFMDKHGLLPKKVIDMSPFHNSLCISNLASIRTNHIYHHCYEFGTTSVFITLGNLREIPKRKNGEIVFEKCMPLGVVMDERICSGSYFALAFRRINKYLKNPSLLELPPEVINEDPGK